MTLPPFEPKLPHRPTKQRMVAGPREGLEVGVVGVWEEVDRDMVTMVLEVIVEVLLAKGGPGLVENPVYTGETAVGVLVTQGRTL